jgi:hypothetical protein
LLAANPLNSIRWLNWKSKKINKKKEAKISSMYSEKQVQALRVFKKISTHTIQNNIHSRLDADYSNHISGSIFLKKPVFLKPSTWTDGFLFFLFFF